MGRLFLCVSARMQRLSAGKDDVFQQCTPTGEGLIFRRKYGIINHTLSMNETSTVLSNVFSAV